MFPALTFLMAKQRRHGCPSLAGIGGQVGSTISMTVAIGMTVGRALATRLSTSLFFRASSFFPLAGHGRIQVEPRRGQGYTCGQVDVDEKIAAT